MTSYLKRLVSSLAAYQVADVVSKFIAVLLLPVYTRYIDPAGYGVVELLANGVILISIVVRFGMIESFLRYLLHRRRLRAPRRAGAPRGLLPADRDDDRRGRCWRRSRRRSASWCSATAITTTFLVAVLGLWSFTNLELAYARAARRRAPARCTRSRR